MAKTVLACVNGRCASVLEETAHRNQIELCQGKIRGQPCGVGDDNGDEGGESPCKHGGYRPPTAGGRQISPCKAGHSPQKDSKGLPWCCKTGTGVCESDEECIKSYGEGYKCQGGECVKTDEEDPYVETPCESGHRKKSGTSKCDEGYFLKVYKRKSGAGESWCCPERERETDECEGGYEKPTGEPCGRGYETKGIGGKAWCCPKEEGDEDAGDQFEWSKELQEILVKLRERFKSVLDYKSPDVMGKLASILDPLKGRMQHLLDYPRGLTPEERQAVINYQLKGVQRGERGELQSMKDRLSRMGIAGSGFELRESGKIRRETKEQESDVRQRLAIDELDRRFEELMGTSGMATQMAQVPIGMEKWDADRKFRELMGTTGAGQGLAGTFMGSEQMTEALNAARRGEGYGSMDALLRYLATVMGGQQSFLGPYMQAVSSQSAGQGGDVSSWMPYLLRYFL